MTNVPHSSLTGADLHESKGVAAAAANTIFVADGAGSGAFAKLPAAAISGLANPFGASLFHVREELGGGVNSNTSGGTLLWLPTALNVVKTNEVGGASLSSNQITLPAGTYSIDAKIPYLLTSHSNTNLFQARLYNLSTAVSLVSSLNARFGTVSNGGVITDAVVQGTVDLRGRFTLAATSVLELQHIKSGSNTPLGWGYSSEVFADALIWKTA